MKKTRIGTKAWQDWNVGEGNRFGDLEALLKELKMARELFGRFCGYAGGNIIDEILLVEKLIKERGKT